VGERYGLPMVSVLDAVSPQFSLKREEGRVISKNQYFYDMFHPTNLGHTIMAKCLGYLFDKVNEGEAGQDDTDGSLLERDPVYGKDFERVRLLDKKELCSKARISEGSFCGTDQKLQEVEIDMDIHGTPQFPYNWQYTGQTEETEPFTLNILCRALLLIFKDEGENDTGKVNVFVDGHYKMTADPRINGWLHCNTAILFSEAESREHIVEILPAPGEEKKKFTILGFGYVL
ncbi:MAG: SGNH/GDSL hydrolase family protein, partial [Clostridiales bacterium]|nr:SGNH/GDSL hydrolase family protein [Clostridiales bacterium]